MSSDRPSGGPSPEAEPDRELGLADALRIRGGPLLEALERHAPGARSHAESTATFAFAAAAHLGLGRDTCDGVREAARLHEVGTVYVPREVLAKPAAEREPDEREQYEARFEAGYRLARGAGIPEQACEWLLRTGESFDGGGPEGLAGDAIPIESRLMRAACAFQSAVAEPSPESTLPPDRRALERLQAQAGAELDPAVVAALAAVVERTGI